MNDNVTPFLKNGRYTDIRVAIADLLKTYPNWSLATSEAIYENILDQH